MPDATSAEDPELLIKFPPAATTIVLLLPVAVKEIPELIVTPPLDEGAKISILPAAETEDPTIILWVLLDFPTVKEEGEPETTNLEVSIDPSNEESGDWIVTDPEVLIEVL